MWYMMICLIKINISREQGRYHVKGFRQYNSSDKNISLNNDVVYAITSDPGRQYCYWVWHTCGGLNCINMKDNSIKSLEDMDKSDFTDQ